MSRANYSEDYDELFPNASMLYQTSVGNAIRGKRGQKFLRDLIAALDALPEKRLITDSLIKDGAVCAIGAVGLARGINMADLDPEDAHAVAETFGIAPRMAREIAFENDELGGAYWVDETPETRWRRMRAWACRNLAHVEITQA